MTISESRDTSLVVSALEGAVLGFSEAAINHPLWAVKTLVQEGKPLLCTPPVYYRGFYIHCISSIPLDIIQLTTTRVFFEKVLPKEIEPSQRKIIAGFIGGALSAFVSCPAEMVMTQELKGLGFLDACKLIVGRNLKEVEILKKQTVLQASTLILSSGKTHRFFTGLIPTIGRDGIFSAGAYGILPLLYEECKKQELSSWTAAPIAGIGSGILTTFLSQGFDTVKTHMQAASNPLSMKATFKKLEMKDLLKGFEWRCARVCSAVGILGNLNIHLEKMLHLKTD
jgi:hypothetical protein